MGRPALEVGDILPRDQGPTSRWDITPKNVVFKRRGSSCSHEATHWFQAQDRRSDNLQTFNGEACMRCGKILKCEERK